MVKFTGVKTMIRLKLKSKEDVEQIPSFCGDLDFNKTWELTIKEYDYSRTNAQNKRYWRLINEIGSFLGYNPEEIHNMMKYKYLSYKNELLGDEVTVVPSTSDLTIKEFLEYQSNIEKFAVSLGFKLEENT